MPDRSLCVIHEAISTDSAIARIAMEEVRIALDAGYRVTVVAKILDSSLVNHVEWLKLTVPRRVFLLQWLTARRFIKSAIKGRTFDIVHSHQPQAAIFSDVFTCHFLTRVAYERKCLERRRALRARVIRIQQQGVLYAEDSCFRNWNPQTHMVYVSNGLKADFERLYPTPQQSSVLVNPFPSVRIPSDEKRRKARAELVGEQSRPVLGFLGGVQERKGYGRLINALRRRDPASGAPAPFLLIGGPFTEGLEIQGLSGAFKAVGMVSDIDHFYAACDVVVVPSVFEPLGMVAFEAAARGIPVIATDEVGALPHLLEHGAGVRWDTSQPLAGLVNELAARRSEFHSSANRMAAAYGAADHGRRLLQIYDQTYAAKQRQGRDAGQATPLESSASMTPHEARV